MLVSELALFVPTQEKEGSDKYKSQEITVGPVCARSWYLKEKNRS